MINSLIFIDTNILLDFYRVRGAGVGLQLLDLIDSHKNIIITGSQIEMEFKKHRQRVILDSMSAQQLPQWGGLTPPAFLNAATPAKMIRHATNTIQKQQEKLKRTLAAVLDSPTKRDRVYRTLQHLFKSKGPYNLDRSKKERFRIRSLARKRFNLGYPPRKSGDTSFGDAINWEWIIHCAQISGKGIILVTRDSDYGVPYKSKYRLNDWLRQEFAERVSRKRRIMITDKLSEAFKAASVAVTKQAADEEAKMLFGYADNPTEVSTQRDDLLQRLLREFIRQRFRKPDEPTSGQEKPSSAD